MAITLNTKLVALRLAGLAPGYVLPTESGDGSGYYEGDLPLFEVTRGARLHLGIPRPGITDKTMSGKNVGNPAGLFHEPRPLCPMCRALFNAIDAGPDAPKARS